MARKKQETLSLFSDAFDLTGDLSDQQFGQLMRAVGAYRFGGQEYSGTDPSVKMAYGFIISQVERYESYCQKRRDAVNERYRGTKGYNGVQKGTNDPSTSISTSDIISPPNGQKAVLADDCGYDSSWEVKR